MVTLCYRPTINGVVRMIDLYKERFEAMGHEVTIFTLGHENKIDDSVVTSKAIPLGKTGYFMSPRLSKTAQAKMQQMDILHCHHLPMTMSYARRYGRCPVVYTNHTRYDLYAQNLSSLPYNFVAPIVRKFWQLATDQADIVISPSQSINALMRQFGITTPIVTVENGIDPQLFSTPANPKTKTALGIPKTAVLLCYVGRLSKEKNLSSLIKQFRQVVETHSNIYLMLVGDGPDAKQLRKLSQQVGLAHNILFCGSVPYQETPNYLAAADLFMTASISEVHPLTLLEAMAAGLPIVAVDAPGNRDIVVHQKTGILVQDETHLADAITSLLAQPDDLHKMGEVTQQLSGQFTIEQTVQKTLDVYHKLLFQPSLFKDDHPNGRINARLWDKIEKGI